MISPMQQFIETFHALNGDTIGERRKSFFKLLNHITQNELSELNFNTLQPKTHLEAIFKVEVLMYFHKSGDLLEILKSENSILIRKILKVKSWFWNEGFMNISGQQFVNDILGNVSFNVKVQLLNKLAIFLKNPKKGNEYYESVKSKYGIYLAGKLLPCCSREFILLCVEKDNVKLICSKLLLIVKKYPDIIENIIDVLNKIGVDISNKYTKVFKLIANNNIELYLKLRQKYQTSVHLGWRCTQKFVNYSIQEVVNNAEDYYQCFHSRQLVRSLNANFHSFYLNMFPKSIDNFSENNCEVLLEIITHLRCPDTNVILKTFKDLYGQELLDNPQLVSLKFLEMVSSTEREAFFQRDYKPLYLTDYECMCYRPIKIAIPYLKDRIAFHSNIRSRIKLVCLLIKTCKINNDKITLAQICQFMVDHHRNDHISVRSAFLNNIQRLFKMEDLDESHWVPINKLVSIFTLNNEWFDEKRKLLKKFILYRLKHNLPIEEQLIEHCESSSYNNFNLFKEYPNFEKHCLLEIANIIPKLYNETNLEFPSSEYIRALINYNHRNKQDQISIFSYPKTIQAAKNEMDADVIMPYCAQLKDNPKECIQLMHYFLTTRKNISINILIYLLHKHLNIVQRHLEKVTNLVLEDTSQTATYFWNHCKNYQHLGIPQIIVKICLNKIEKNSKISQKVHESSLMLALSCLLPPEEYLQIITLHYPRGLKAESESLTDQKMFDLQKGIGTSLRYIVPSSEALESILIFCKGDYLKLVWSTLYAICSRINEDKLMPFIIKLIDRPVSVRKHALHLTFDMASIGSVNNVMDKFIRNEKNASIRQYLFKHSFQFFVKNRNNHSWELVKTTIAAVELNDHESFGIFVQPEKVPNHYIIEYLIFAWEFLDGLPDPNNKIENKKAKIINSMQKVISELYKKFSKLRNIIEKYFFKLLNSNKVTDFQSEIQQFACKYVIYCEPAYMPSLFDILKTYISSTWYNEETEISGVSNVQKFIHILCNEFLNNVDALSHVAVLTDFIDLWNILLKPEDAFAEYLHLQLTVIYLKCKTINSTATELANLCNGLATAYGIEIVKIISKKINNFPSYFVKSSDQNSVYDLIDHLVVNHFSLPCTLLAINLIDSRRNRVSSETKEIYKKVIQTLRLRHEPAIKIFLKLHMYK